MERSATDDDLITCPDCESRNGLRIRWIPGIGRGVHELTEVGCRTCNKWRSDKEDRWVFAQWNVWASKEWESKGRNIAHSRLHALLLQQSEHQKAESIAAKAVEEYLSSQVAAHSQWIVRDRFESLHYPGGIWSVASIKAVYGTNTGPFCILTAKPVLPSGILCTRTEDFWDIPQHIRRIPLFWIPRYWSQVVKGDDCMVEDGSGQILSCNPRRRRATVMVEGRLCEVRTLGQIQVPIHRIESEA
jgi:hypothetical protein